MTRDDLRLDAGDVVTIELTLAPSSLAAAPASRLPRMPELGPPALAVETANRRASYRELRRRPDAEPGQEIVAPEMLPPAQEVFLAMPDRWNVAMPEWNRYGRSGEYPYVRASHWWDPFNRNRLKGDEPIFGQQTFLNITANCGHVSSRSAAFRRPATSARRGPGVAIFSARENSSRWTKHSGFPLICFTATRPSGPSIGAFASLPR